MNIPILPSGTPVIGGITAAIGYSILIPPLGWAVSVAGILVSLSYFRLRSSVLVIEDEDKGRHMVGGREGSLMRLCLMTDRLRRGASIEEARSGLEKIENEVPIFPAFQDASGMPAMKALPWPPSPPNIDLSNATTGLDEDSHIKEEEISDIPDPSDFGFGGFGFIEDEPLAGVGMNGVSSEVSTISPSDNSISAYERAWGREEAPSWYREKEPVPEIASRNGHDPSETTDIFGFGGMFDSDNVEDQETMAVFGFENSFDVESTPKTIQRPPSSSQMIRRAHTQNGFPKSDYRDSLLPTPTEEAVREECGYTGATLFPEGALASSVPLALASSVPLARVCRHLIIRDGTKAAHVREAARASDVPLESVLYLDDRRRDVLAVRALGASAVHCPDGLTLELLCDGLRRHAARERI